jgi:putative (di)nucleoside polyphosphate hydrolase
VGTDKAEMITRTADWIPYEFPDDLIPKLWDGQFRGQTQIWYLMRFTGTDDDFSLDLHEREFSEIQWLDRQTLVDRVVWFKRKSYLEMLAEFAPHFPY